MEINPNFMATFKEKIQNIIDFGLWNIINCMILYIVIHDNNFTIYQDGEDGEDSDYKDGFIIKKKIGDNFFRIDLSPVRKIDCSDEDQIDMLITDVRFQIKDKNDKILSRINQIKKIYDVFLDIYTLKPREQFELYDTIKDYIKYRCN